MMGCIKTLGPALWAGLLLLSVASGGVAQGDAGGTGERSTLARLRRGHEILIRAWAALGGPRYDSLHFLYVERAGSGYGRLQSLHPDKPFNAEPWTLATYYDLKEGRVVLDQRYGFAGGVRFAVRSALGPDEGYLINLNLRQYAELPPAFLPDNELPYRSLPQALVSRARSSLQSVRWLDEVVRDGELHDAVSFAWGSRSLYTLYFARTSGLLSSVEVVLADAWAGQDVLEFRFLDYAPVSGIPFPRTIEGRRGGALTSTLQVTVRLDEPIADSLMVVPQGFAATDLSPPRVTELGAGAFMLENVGASALGYYNVPFVDLGDGIAVIDAPIGSGVGELVMAKVRETIPDKPITHLILTHYHADHVGGIRPFVADGVTLVTTGGNRRYLEQLAAADYILAPDRLQRQTPRMRPRFQWVDGELRLGSGSGRIEVRQIGPTPHVDEMLVVYLPGLDLLFQADLVLPNQPDIANARFFRSWLAGFGESVAIVAGTHHPILSPEMFAEWGVISP